MLALRFADRVGKGLRTSPRDDALVNEGLGYLAEVLRLLRVEPAVDKAPSG